MQQDFHHGLLRLGLLAAACLAGLTGGAAAQAGSTGSAPFLVIRHATLLAGTTPFPGVDRALVVEGAVVRWVGADVDLRLPPDAATLDVGGRVVIPGLIDLHQHAASVSAAPSRWLSNGVTTVRDPGADLERARRTRAAIEAGRMAGPRLFVGLLLDLSAGQTRGSVRRDVAEAAAAGIDLVKLYMRTPAAHAQVAIQEAHARGLPVTWHLSVPLSRALDFGVDGVEHLYIFGELLPEWSGTAPATTADAFLQIYTRWADHLDPSSARAGRLLQLLAATGTVWTPTLVLGHRLASGQLPLTRGWSAEDRARALRGFDAACRMVGEAARRGVTIGAGTDTEEPGDLHEELALLVRCGLSPRAALRGATATAARALGRADTLGAIDVGQYADVVVLEGDPSEAIEATARIWRVVKDGRVYDPVRLRAVGR